MLAPLAASLVLLVISSVVKGISGRGVRRTGKGYVDKKLLVPLNLLSNIKITKCLNYEHRFNDVFSRNKLSRTIDGGYVINLAAKKNKQIGFHYLLKEIQLYTSIIWN